MKDRRNKILDLRLDLVGRIFSHHVQDCQLTSRMFVEPGIESQNHVFENNNGMARRDHPFDQSWCQDAIATHSW